MLGAAAAAPGVRAGPRQARRRESTDLSCLFTTAALDLQAPGRTWRSQIRCAGNPPFHTPAPSGLLERRKRREGGTSQEQCIQNRRWDLPRLACAGSAGGTRGRKEGDRISGRPAASWTAAAFVLQSFISLGQAARSLMRVRERETKCGRVGGDGVGVRGAFQCL